MTGLASLPPAEFFSPDEAAAEIVVDLPAVGLDFGSSVPFPVTAGDIAGGILEHVFPEMKHIGLFEDPELDGRHHVGLTEPSGTLNMIGYTGYLGDEAGLKMRIRTSPGPSGSTRSRTYSGI